MSLLKFIGGLLPRLSKTGVLEDLRLTRKEFVDVVVPSFTLAEPQFKSEKFKQPALEQLETVFYRNFDARRGQGKSNLLMEIANALPTLQTNLAFIEAQLEHSLEPDIIRDGLTVRKSVLLSAADDFGFISRFSLSLLDYVCSEQLADMQKITTDRPPIKNQQMAASMAPFAVALQLHSLKPAEYSKQLNALPEVVVNAANYDAIHAVHNSSSDLGNFDASKSFIQSPIYHFRMQIAEWQANRFKKMQDKKRVVELRLLLLRNLQSDTPDPAVEREIAYLQDRIESLEYKMDKLAS